MKGLSRVMRTSPHIALFDMDLWTYDIAFAAQRKEEDGTTTVLSFDYCKDFVDIRFQEIMEKLKCSKYEAYLTGEGNFRHDLATILPYKGNRSQPRPWHYDNIRNYLQFAYGAVIVDGMEADDILAIQQTKYGDQSVIVSRDKDLKMVKGWHYGYPVGNQKEQDLHYVTKLGELFLIEKGKKKVCIGNGLKWFYAQCIMGDKTDNIQGIPKGGDVLAFNTLNECNTEQEMKDATLELYERHFGESAREAFLENARLLWMVTETAEDGTSVMWSGL